MLDYQPEFYVGGSAGLSMMDTGVTATSGGTDLDEDDFGYKAYVGWQVNEIFGVEAHYADFGGASISGNSGDSFRLKGVNYAFANNNAEIDLDARSIGVAPVIGVNVTDWFRPFVKAGVHYWDFDAELTDATGSASASDDGTDFFYGAGAEFRLHENFAVRAEFERFQFEELDVDFVSAGANIRF